MPEFPDIEAYLPVALTPRVAGCVLAYRGLSRLPGKDWPRTQDEPERLRGGD